METRYGVNNPNLGYSLWQVTATGDDGLSYQYFNGGLTIYEYSENVEHNWVSDKQCNTATGSTLWHYITRYGDSYNINQIYIELMTTGVVRIYIVPPVDSNVDNYGPYFYAAGMNTAIKTLDSNTLYISAPTYTQYLVHNLNNIAMKNDPTSSGTGGFAPKLVNKSKAGYVDLTPYSTREQFVTVDANGGTFSNGQTQSNQILDSKSKSLVVDAPTRDGYTLDRWNTKADGTGDDTDVLRNNLQLGQTIYAIWRRNSDVKPVKATIDCSRQNNGAICAIQVFYQDATKQTRELTTTGTNQLSWGDVDPIPGINLTRDGYAGDASCSLRDGSSSQCYYVSLNEAPPTTANYVAATPQTGDPASSVWQRTSYLIGLLAVVVAGMTVVRQRDRKTV